MESPNYIGSIQQGTKTIKYTSYKHPSNHTEKIEWLPTIEIQSYSFFFFLMVLSQLFFFQNLQNTDCFSSAKCTTSNNEGQPFR